MKSISSLIRFQVILLTFIISGCSGDAEVNDAGGAKLLYAKCSNSEPSHSISFSRSGNTHLLVIEDVMSEDIHAAILSPVANRRATLELISTQGHRCCECPTKAEVEISSRNLDGTILYVIENGSVINHIEIK